MKSSTKKVAKKELENSIADKFMKAIAELGHDSEKLKRVIKKASKFIVKKIERNLKDIKHVAVAKLDPVPVKDVVKKAVATSATAKKDIVKKVVKVEKVIAKATKVAERKVAKPTEKAEKVVAKKPAVATAAKKPASKAAASKTKTEAQTKNVKK
jgi:hypothetical protein